MEPNLKSDAADRAATEEPHHQRADSRRTGRAEINAVSRNPLISIVIPTRNRQDTLRIALSGLKAHKSKSIEILVHDNASDAGVKTVVAEAAKADPRIVYRRSEVSL